MILADRLNRIINEQQISKAEFARRIGVTPQYVLLLTGNAKARPESIKPALAKLIALEFDCDYEWLLHGKEPENKPFVVAIKLQSDQLGKGRLNAFGTCLGVACQQKNVLRCHADPPCKFCLADLLFVNNPV